MTTMHIVLFGLIGAACIVIGLEAGRRLGLRGRHGGDREEGFGSLKASIYGLMGLLLAFTFNDAMNRWDARRQLAAQELNDIGTVWLRIDLLPHAAQPEMRTDVMAYVDARIAYYDGLTDDALRTAASIAADDARARIWGRAVEATRIDSTNHVGRALLPAINAMFDTASLRVLAIEAHPPPVIFLLLVVLVLLTALLTGHETARNARRSPLHIAVFTCIMALSLYVIFDLQYPRIGFIRIDAVDEALRALRAGW